MRIKEERGGRGKGGKKDGGIKGAAWMERKKAGRKGARWLAEKEHGGESPVR